MADKKLNYDEIAYFCEQLHMMLGAGMNLSDGMDIIAEGISGRLKDACAAVSEELNNGSPLGDAMEKCGLFPDYAVKMVRVGTISGSLESVLDGLRDYYEERAELIRTVRAAVLHPLLLLVIMTVVIIVLVVAVLPMFGDIFAQFDSTVSQLVGNTVDAAFRTGTIIMCVLLALIAAAAVVGILSVIPGARCALSRFASRFPLTRGISVRFARAKAAKAMQIMVAAGLTPEDTLEYAAALVDNADIHERLLACCEKVKTGESFAQTVADSGVFPALYSRSLNIAYSSGSQDKAWNTISQKCTEEAQHSTEVLISFIEPAIIIVLVTMISAILLTVMIPLMNILSVL